MASTTVTNDIQKYTRLPLMVLEVAGQPFPDIWVTTPHKGKVQVSKKFLTHGFFSGTRQHDKNSSLVLDEIRDLEIEARDFLVEEWKKTIKN